MSDGDANFSRGSDSALFGLCTEEVKTKVDDDTKDKFQIAAREAGYAYPAEFLRNIVYVIAHGEEEVKRRMNDRLNAVTNLGLNKTPFEK